MAAYEYTNNDIIKGGHLMIFVGDGESGMEPLAFATSHSLSKSLNTNEISTKDHGDTAAVIPQNKTWEATTENLYSLEGGYKKLNEYYEAMKPVYVYFGETTYGVTGGTYTAQDSIVGVTNAQNWEKYGFGEQGQAYITSLQVTAGAGDNATFSATFTGNGGLTVLTGQ